MTFLDGSCPLIIPEIFQRIFKTLLGTWTIIISPSVLRSRIGAIPHPLGKQSFDKTPLGKTSNPVVWDKIVGTGVQRSVIRVLCTTYKFT